MLYQSNMLSYFSFAECSKESGDKGKWYMLYWVLSILILLTNETANLSLKFMFHQSPCQIWITKFYERSSWFWFQGYSSKVNTMVQWCWVLWVVWMLHKLLVTGMTSWSATWMEVRNEQFFVFTRTVGWLLHSWQVITPSTYYSYKVMS